MGAFCRMDLERQYEGREFTGDAGLSAFEEDAELGLMPTTDSPPPPAVPEAADSVPAATPLQEQKKQDGISKNPPASTGGEDSDTDGGKEDAAEDDDAKRKAHEEAEAKRKAEWEAKQKEKKAALQEKIDRVAAMSDDEVMMASAKQVGADTEKITRRNMKDCVTEFIQTKCLDEPDFARKVMNPNKNMIHCFRYISRKAWEYVQDELKVDGITPGPGAQGYGCDVPDDLCFQWSVDYFNDPDAEEDKVEEEKFVPKPYHGKTAKSTNKSKKAAKKAETKKTEARNPASKPTCNSDQLTLGDFAMPEGKAG